MKPFKLLQILGMSIRGWLPGDSVAMSPSAFSAYREATWMSWWYFLIFAGTAVVLTAVTLVQLASGALIGNSPAPTVLLIVWDALFVLITPAFARFTVSIDPTRITLRFGLVARKIPMKDVASATTAQAKAGNYGGIGIRYGIDGSKAFLRSFGPAVKVISVTSRDSLLDAKCPRSQSINQFIP